MKKRIRTLKHRRNRVNSGESAEGGDMVGVGTFPWDLARILVGRTGEGNNDEASRSLLWCAEGRNDAIAKQATEYWDVNACGGVDIVEKEGSCEGPATPEAVVISPRKLERSEDESSTSGSYSAPIPPLNICIMVVGTRGDVQPFIALGKGLKIHGHRVRLASHEVYKDFVMTAGLEFFPLGGDPKVMSEFVVRNRGILPTRIGDVHENRKQLKDIVFSTYDACTRSDPYGQFGCFQADVIIANPPSYGHIHCAERLGIPLHMIFTMPWTPTVEFVNPHARISDAVMSKLEYITGLLPKERADRWNSYVRERMNWISFRAVEDIVSLGLKDIIDQFRVEVLGLKPLPNTYQTRHLLDLKGVPFTYCWSPSLVSKPLDWGDNIDVVGFFFLNQTDYTPPDDLVRFLEAGEPPVYIGFGSMVVDDPEELSKTIVEAVEATGLRAIVSRGWGGLGSGCELSESIFIVGNCPHEWLFQRCSGVVHHGGAGTTAAGLLAGCPTFVVPFFGDQPFWGEACYAAGVGPEPIPIDELNVKNLMQGLAYVRLPKLRERAEEIAIQMQREDGVAMAIEAFHRHLPRDAVVHKKKLIWNLAEVGSDIETSHSLPEDKVLPPRKLGRWYWLWSWLCCPPTRRKRRRKHHRNVQDRSSRESSPLLQ